MSKYTKEFKLAVVQDYELLMVSLHWHVPQMGKLRII